MKRMNAINMSKSVLNAVILDRDEMYDKQYTTLAGLTEVIDRFMLQLSGATGIPVTPRLYGRLQQDLMQQGNLISVITTRPYRSSAETTSLFP